ncbi:MULTISPECIES: nuclease-related domain-containing protein [Mammaliicoccus]|uniref:nuclease-related domain-containing protein n=1 Tax=Mammaliicoccus TaxID=2803850 RepID=UPI000DF90842|nr:MULTISPECIES: nuclease-related domain-containing protein [Mammaliicoccus]RTX88343.1 NERD domain-containing protein [Mammaliicoccus fleurettii]SUM36225.1 Nuclease-related domain [Mammaliicoccus fleurettii]HCN61002.1 hypothetical protein [Staphylococcus sp.]
MEIIKDEKYLKSIIGRAELSDNLFNKVQNKSSGNDGERYFNAILKCMEHIVYINDFQFTLNNQVQIDMLVIDDRAIYLFEIKNYKGIYYLEDTFFKNNYGNSITSPLIQIERAKNEFHNLCKYLEIDRPIISKLVFTNPYFNFKNPTPYKERIILPSELGIINQLFSNQNPEENIKIKQKLLAERNSFDNQYYKSITLPFKNIKPGIKCPKCNHMFTVKIKHKRQKCTCMYCESIMDKKFVYEYNLKELWYLKQDSFTISEAIWWLGGGTSIYSVRRICESSFKAVGSRYKKYYL